MSPPALGSEQRRALLRLARDAVAAGVEGRSEARPDVAPALAQPGAAFVTLTRRSDGELRGCVGYVEAIRPLAETVAEAARLACSEDRRFDPVTSAELDDLRVEISVLSPLLPTRPEEIVVGVHGVVLRLAGRSGLLLPQVPVEHGWDRATFLDQLCRKAGLPPGAWKEPGTALLAFTAEVFAEDDSSA